MPLEPDSAEFNDRIESLTHALDASPDADARSAAKELARLILDFHARGLARMLEVMGSDGPLNQRLTSDPVVAALLDLHDLTPPAIAASSQNGARPEGPLLQIIREDPRNASVAATPPHSVDAAVCELCGEPIAAAHNHYVDLTSRRLVCSCRACWLLSGAERAASVRPVPERYLQSPALQLRPEQWDALQVPVSIAFFMINTAIGRTVAFYPSPAGATESALPLTMWRDIEETNPWIRTLAPDVEALLVRRKRDAEGGCDGFIVPIDACYDLVGRIRIRWEGFGGGEEVYAEIDRFFEQIADRSRGSGAAAGGAS